MDSKGKHCDMCASGRDRTRRHHAVGNKVAQFADAAGLRPELDKPGLLQPCFEQPNAQQCMPVMSSSLVGGTEPRALI